MDKTDRISFSFSIDLARQNKTAQKKQHKTNKQQKTTTTKNKQTHLKPCFFMKEHLNIDKNT